MGFIPVFAVGVVVIVSTISTALVVLKRFGLEADRFGSPPQ